MVIRGYDEIQRLWEEGGPYIGANGAPHARIFVEPGWSLKTTGPIVGNYKKGPIRYWTDADNEDHYGLEQSEEIPQHIIKSIQIDRSIDADAATCRFVLKNIKMDVNGEDENAEVSRFPDPEDPEEEIVTILYEELGDPGYYSFARSSRNLDAKSRWNHDPNVWGNRIAPGMLFRTLQGYGGNDLSWGDALIGGWIVRTGTWISDSVQVSTNGLITVTCRDMAKLLIDQHCYPPLVPEKQYPLRYERWSYVSTAQEVDLQRKVYGTATGMPAPTDTVKQPGNYKDYSEVIVDLLLWSGWYLPAGPGEHDLADPPVNGNIEHTGHAAEKGPLSQEFFSQKPMMEIIKQIRDIVGFNFWVDELGAVRWEVPNWWTICNFWDDGERTNFIPEIDEKVQLTDYTLDYSSDNWRSDIIISTVDPATYKANDKYTVTTHFAPPTASLLRGIVRPAMWVNGLFTVKEDQEAMAELVAMQMYFAMRKGSITCSANPLISINDQVRIFERQTSEAFVHYVRGASTSMDLDTGLYTMTLTTNWLGNETDWVADIEFVGDHDITVSYPKFQVSDNLKQFLSTIESPKLVPFPESTSNLQASL